MNSHLKILILPAAALIGVAVFYISQPADAATFTTNAAKMVLGDTVSSKSTVNKNTTQFIFAEITTNPVTNKKSAFLQWAPLMPAAKGYRNGTSVDKGGGVRLWINGVWYNATFDGNVLFLR